MTINIQPIGKICTPYKEKFAIPRQPGLVKSAVGKVTFFEEFNDPNYLRGIEQFSHLWLLFRFHHTADKGHSPLVRPPRLGGNQKLGVFATRSTFRPNSLGMSVVEFKSLCTLGNQVTLTVKGMDLLDGTPIIDIKPYIPYADSITHAQGGIAQDSPDLMEVTFNKQATEQLQQLEHSYPTLGTLIREVLSQDPRPAYHHNSQPDKTYGMGLYDLNIQWQVIQQQNVVIAIQKN
ncbi:tRNA (N6-threonylcarbamoyladenosine(37)-N6)-methyltransferase TrmO [uncultured Paraglaciecola sp.]|uniref:tRNA (N6-threonylcarbamoyladenosine(37)-N6)-methyltransferase TrmO n=1 Tax=uncultured Paraglaciecola sp. TaxID=1765024 RepID=UPI0026223067|nr:tRNA (N6-threonylcarbamoyladenosine(37)-N6)-methyltransferase TrmO [uncultured Paraglaciecola sp.]